MEIWAVNFQVLFVSKNMLKNIATAFSECTTQYENMASYSIGYTVAD